MTNIKVRIAMSNHNVPQWKLARLLGVSEVTIWRKLREELPEEEQTRLVKIIEGGEDKDKVRLSVTLDSETLALLDDYCAGRGITRREAVTEAICEYIEELYGGNDNE